MTLENLQNKIIEEFGSDVTQESYLKKADRGLWESERILIEKYFKPGSTVLDVGCGTGRTTIPLYNLGYKVKGVDLVPEMIQNAKKIVQGKELNIDYEVGDATKLKYEDNFFDNIIFSTNGFGQIPSKQKRSEAIKEMHRVLKLGGHFVLVAHERSKKDFGWFWVKSFVKIYILKPLGVKIEEIDFGDYIFIRNVNGVDLEQTQFMHIANNGEIVKQIKDAGFDIVVAQRENEITDFDVHDQDNVYDYPPMIYVCKK
ncbi:MAG: class I SAM-dependent methyltransferase [Patescibacteria group bacterium]|jgi:ubiquinone/menaquinone biosynthesis C-methylase UbiE|nr:class I SAM-dependent methyltransferase [Patescibacteria group bacterium]